MSAKTAVITMSNPVLWIMGIKTCPLQTTINTAVKKSDEECCPFVRWNKFARNYYNISDKNICDKIHKN